MEWPPESSISPAVAAEDIRPRSLADFRRKWTPTDFCTLPLLKRTSILLSLLTNLDPILILPMGGGFQFQLENVPIRKAISLLHESNSNRQIAREACELFYKANMFILSSPWIPNVVQEYANTHIKNETVRPYLLFRSLRIRLDYYQPQKPLATSREMGKLLSCDHLDRLEIKICIAMHPKKIKERAVNAAKAIAPAVHQLKEKFGMALKVLIGRSSAVEEEKDITWLWETPDPELVGKVNRGEGDESDEAWVDVWMAWYTFVDEGDGGCEDGLERFLNKVAKA